MKTSAFELAIQDIQQQFLSTLDISNTYKLFSQIELALWHYEDIHADNNNVSFLASLIS